MFLACFPHLFSFSTVLGFFYRLIPGPDRRRLASAPKVVLHSTLPRAAHFSPESVAITGMRPVIAFRRRPHIVVVCRIVALNTPAVMLILHKKSGHGVPGKSESYSDPHLAFNPAD